MANPELPPLRVGPIPEDFDLLNAAFDRMTRAERWMVLNEFARLQFVSVGDRWFEAVHRTIVRTFQP